MSSSVIADNSRVTLHFAIKLADGQIVDSNFEAEPAIFSVGDGQMLEGFELQCSAIDSNIDLSMERLESYDLIVSDVSLGPDKLNGIDFTRTMREKGCTVPVLLVSAHFPAEAMKWEQSDSVTLGIRKPLEYSLLVAGLAKLFELHGDNGPLEFS